MPDITPPPQPSLKIPKQENQPEQNSQPHVLQDELMEEQSETTKKTNIKSVLSTVMLFLAAPILALVLIIFVIQSYEVDGPSMQETLQDNDLLIVSKVPKTISKITHKPYIPPRYQIIIFSKDEGTGLSRQLVKRVIALPGERVVVKNGSVTVFNQSNPNGFNPDVDQEYSKTIKNTPGLADLQVGENQVFVLGDNRLNSLDSRNFGTVEANSIVGKLGIRIFPLNKARTF
jgi:signal peptidase I